MNWKQPTALIVGRFQPFHGGHRALILKSAERVGQVCIGVRDTGGTDDRNPLGFDEVKDRIIRGLPELAGRIDVMRLPNISHVFYGRDVGYGIERIYLDPATEAISATKIREAKIAAA